VPGFRRVAATPSQYRQDRELRKRQSVVWAQAGSIADAIALVVIGDATFVPHMWYKHRMARVRISTTVDELLLATARQTRSGLADAALIDEALGALLARHRTGEIDAAYAAYDRIPVDADDEWGNLASFRTAAGAS
jgi:antitoxin MazE5